MSSSSWLFLTFLAAIALGVAAWLLLRVLNSPSLPATIQGVRVEVTAARLAEDRVFEHVWTVPVVLTNTTHRPRTVPVCRNRPELSASLR